MHVGECRIILFYIFDPRSRTRGKPFVSLCRVTIIAKDAGRLHLIRVVYLSNTSLIFEQVSDHRLEGISVLCSHHVFLYKGFAPK